MSQQNKTTLQQAINAQLADNTAGDISAADIRSTIINVTDSMVLNNGDQGMTGSLEITGNVTASAFIGDGSALTNITAEWDGSHNGDAEITGSLTTSGNVNILGGITGSSFTGSFVGDGSELTGIDIPNIATLVSGAVGFTETVVITETSVAFADIASEDLTSANWTGNVFGSGMLNNMSWSQGAATIVSGSTNANGRQYYNLTDTNTSTAQSGWQIRNANIGAFVTEGVLNSITFSVLKTSLVKPALIFISKNSSLSFSAQPIFTLKTDGTVGVGTNQGTTCPNGMTVVDNTTEWEYTVDVLGSAVLQFGILPVLKAQNGGGYASHETGDITITAPYIKTGLTPGIVTTTTVTELNKLEQKHIVPTISTSRGVTAAPNEVAFAIVMGQSNAAGTAGTSPATGDIDCVYTMTAGDYEWSAYVNNNSNIYHANGSVRSNPLTELAREWQARRNADATVPDLYIINCSYSGTGFDWSANAASQWDPFRRKNNAIFYELPVVGVTNTTKSLFWTANKAIKEGLMQFAKAGLKAYHIGTVWNQWENDGVTTGAINRYPANLQMIRKMVDAELGLVDADFYAWRPNNQRASLPTMQSHFDNFAANNNNAFLINVQDMPMYTGTAPTFGIFESDNIHYTAAAQVLGAKQVLDNGWFSTDAGGKSTRRAREVTMNVENLAASVQMSANGGLYETQVDNSGAYTTTSTAIQPV